MRIICGVVLAFFIHGCATPRAWVQVVTPTGGVIGYQNYDPATDGNARINALIRCPSHRMVWSGLRSSATVPAYYMSNNFIVPLSENVQWAEYHYECVAGSIADQNPKVSVITPRTIEMPAAQLEVAPTKEVAAPDPATPPLATTEYENFEVILNECVPRSAGQLECRVAFRNKSNMGSARRLSISSTYVEQNGGRSQDKVVSILNGLTSPIAWHSGRFCTVEPLGSCSMTLIYSGVNLVPGSYTVNFRLYLGALGSRSLVSLESTHK